MKSNPQITTFYLFRIRLFLFSMNSKYAPYLPADDGESTIENYGRMIDKKFSLQPLLRAIELSDNGDAMHEPSTSGITRKISVRTTKLFAFFLFLLFWFFFRFILQQFEYLHCRKLLF